MIAIAEFEWLPVGMLIQLGNDIGEGTNGVACGYPGVCSSLAATLNIAFSRCVALQSKLKR